jgi:predicted O-methyltransferase YrrM
MKQVIKRTPLYPPLRQWKKSRQFAREIVECRRRELLEQDASVIAEWEKRGRPVPPPHLVKQQTLRSFAKRFGLEVLVETGTYQGSMIEALKHDFRRIYSIELGKELHQKAQQRFKAQKHIELIQGDSGTELGKLMTRIDRATLFWLDGHYSAGDTAQGKKDTPILEELTHILDARDQGHVIIIDDAREFGTAPDYPTVQEIVSFVHAKRRHLSVAVEHDSIRITPTDASAGPK